MNSRLAAILVLLVCWAFASALSQTPVASISPATAPECDDTFECVSKDDACTHSWDHDFHYCQTNNGTNCCAIGLGCFNDKCATNNYGASCGGANGPCVSYADEELICSPTNHTCVYLSYAGDSCDDTSICAPGLSCTSGTCIGQPVGAACFPGNITCNNGLFCSDALVCEYLLPSGALCNTSATANACYNGYCYEETCHPLFNVVDNGVCLTHNDCSGGNTCYKGKCVAPVEDLETCETSSDCANGGECVCSHFSGKSFCRDNAYDPCLSERTEAQTCANKYNCTSMKSNENSCFYKNCYSKLEDIHSCSCANSDTALDSCYYNDFCGGFPGWAIILLVVGAIAVVLAIVAVIFVVMKKNSSTYDSI